MDLQRPNRLAQETSPYLLQHAANPVDWYPWGDEALARARQEGKPILLSIGYSACHWCHVMAHESFEDEGTARLMNDNFVNIKVDREERPDLDVVYMEAVQAIIGSGGWPLTVFLTPEGKPFYGGTYFPPEDRHGMPGFARVLKAVADFYHNRRGEVEQAARKITTALEARADAGQESGPLVADTLSQAFSALKGDFDVANGGFGTAPKFPQPLTLEFLLRYHGRTGSEQALSMVETTLENMVKGGIYDQIGGGFHRYATDARWLVPHFEKMLYDNALLGRAYLDAYIVTGRALFRRITEETIDYVLREMTSPEGGFYSTQDADSEGMEGKYYLWSYQEVVEVLGSDAARMVNDYYGVTTKGNFEGANILHIHGDVPDEEPDIIKQAKASLLCVREKRVRPARDDKVLTSWNGLMLAGLAEAACVLDREDYLAAGIANASFVLKEMMSAGYLKHTYREGKATIEGYLDDYALLIEGLLSLHQASFDGRWLREGIRLTDVMVEEFWDESTGMFYDTGGKHEELFVRPRNTHDGAVPSGPSAATLALLKVSRLTGNQRLEEMATASLKAVQGLMARHPLAFGNWLCALDFCLSQPREIAIVGSHREAAAAGLLRVLFNTWLPNKVVAACDPADTASMDDVILLQDRSMIDQRPTVFVCDRRSCRRPVNDPDSLRKLLHGD
ncbi:MAG: thioredoxin domain-containing protein [Dehalococcoidia bacterium]|nr:thioredoxin domain-containing protein [Dehalococcoidia bacterium]